MQELESYIELLKLILPEFLIDIFNLISFSNSEEKLHLYFDKKNTTPKEFTSVELVSKDFMGEIAIQDFLPRTKVGDSAKSLDNLNKKKSIFLNPLN